MKKTIFQKKEKVMKKQEYKQIKNFWQKDIKKLNSEFNVTMFSTKGRGDFYLLSEKQEI